MDELTDQQELVLAFISAWVIDYGYPPTITEISKNFGWSSPNAAKCHLVALQKKGAIEVTANIARGIKILNEDYR